MSASAQHHLPRKWLNGREAAVLLALAACLLWAFWPVIEGLLGRWATESIYSHGFLVPGFAAFLLWLRRDKIRQLQPGYHWAGLPILLAGACLRLAGAYIYLESLEGFALLVCLAGLTVFVGGRTAWRWAWPALAFLIFMIPLPFSAERALAAPLQRLATAGSTYALQTLGLPALAEGNVIHLREVRLGIAEACNGLGMLVTFVALCTALAIVINRPLLDKVIVFLSAVPIALLTNVLRITLTGVLHETVGSGMADFFHWQMAPWAMMSMGLGLVWIEIQILERLFLAPLSRPVGAAPVVPFVNPASSVAPPVAHPSKPNSALFRATT